MLLKEYRFDYSINFSTMGGVDCFLSRQDKKEKYFKLMKSLKSKIEKLEIFMKNLAIC